MGKQTYGNVPISLRPVGLGYLMAVVRGFYDGRGSNSQDLMTLSCLVGDDDAWCQFQKEWSSRVLPLLNGEALSVTDCLHSGGGNRLKGIPHTNRMGALHEASKILDRWVGREIMPHSVAVSLIAHREAASKGRQLVAPAALCVDHIIPIIEYVHTSANGLEYFFDQGEPFLREVRPYWNENPLKRKNGPYYLRRVKILTSAASSDYIALQACDVYTWLVHTYCAKTYLGSGLRDIPEELGLLISSPINSWFCDLQFLMSQPKAINRILAQMEKVPVWAIQ